MDYYRQIKKIIEEQISLGHRNFILFPFGERGMQVKRILNEIFGIREICIIDNHLSQIDPHIYKKFTLVITHGQ